MPDPINDRLVKTLSFIRRFIDDNKASPTIKEIADHLRIRPPSAQAQVNRLEAAGYIKRIPKQWRSIRVIHSPPKEDLPIREHVRIPVVGKVAAGSPILAEENVVDHLLV